MPDGSVNFTVNTTDGLVPVTTYTRDEFLDTLGYLQFAGLAMRGLDGITPNSYGIWGYDSAGVAQQRPITAGSGITVDNGNGVSGAPTVRVTGTTISTHTENYLATVTDGFLKVDAVGGAIIITLPTAVSNDGQVYNIKKIDASGNYVTVTPAGAETIDGAATKIMSAQWVNLSIISDGVNWLIQ